jgi:hypothetical protein
MNDNGAREREIDELARLLPVPPARDFPSGRQQILKEHLMTQIRPTDTTTRRSNGSQRTKRPRGLVAVAGASAAAVALAAFFAGNTLQPRSRPQVAEGQSAKRGTQTTAAELLATIARAAASRPSPVVRNGEFMYIRSEVAWQVDTIVDGRETSAMEKLHERQIWLPVANVCATGLLIEQGSRTPLSVFPAAGSRVAGSEPSGNEPRLAFSCPSEGHLGDASYRLLQSMPTRPAALLKYLRAGKRWTNDDPATEIGDLISESIIPPAVAAALYRVAEQLPGATVVPDATNAIGRPGIGIAWTDPGQPQYRTLWIFSKKTLQYIGTRDYNIKTGAVNGESAILQRAFVAKAGQLP